MSKYKILEEAVRRIRQIPCEPRYNRDQLLRDIVDDVYRAGRAYEREKNIVLGQSMFPGHPIVQAIRDDV